MSSENKIEKPSAYITLVATDAYLKGAVVLAYSIRNLTTTKLLICLVTPDLSSETLVQLHKVYDHVIEVPKLDSKDKKNLELLGRPELGLTVTKIFCWEMDWLETILFLDADTLVLKNLDHLFEKYKDVPFAACPDIGWPDCFNSGVFICKPNKETYKQLLKKLAEEGSFDGGDQGLLNSFFKDWNQSPNQRMPFIYNVTPTSFYSYAPALKKHEDDIAVMHFIGKDKPWHQEPQDYRSKQSDSIHQINNSQHFDHNFQAENNSKSLQVVNDQNLSESGQNIFSNDNNKISNMNETFNLNTNIKKVTTNQFINQWWNHYHKSVQDLEITKEDITTQSEAFLKSSQIQGNINTSSVKDENKVDIIEQDSKERHKLDFAYERRHFNKHNIVDYNSNTFNIINVNQSHHNHDNLNHLHSKGNKHNHIVSSKDHYSNHYTYQNQIIHNDHVHKHHSSQQHQYNYVQNHQLREHHYHHYHDGHKLPFINQSNDPATTHPLLPSEAFKQLKFNNLLTPAHQSAAENEEPFPLFGAYKKHMKNAMVSNKEEYYTKNITTNHYKHQNDHRSHKLDSQYKFKNNPKVRFNISLDDSNHTETEHSSIDHSDKHTSYVKTSDCHNTYQISHHNEREYSSHKWKYNKVNLENKNQSFTTSSMQLSFDQNMDARYDIAKEAQSSNINAKQTSFDHNEENKSNELHKNQSHPQNRQLTPTQKNFLVKYGHSKSFSADETRHQFTSNNPKLKGQVYDDQAIQRSSKSKQEYNMALSNQVYREQRSRDLKEVLRRIDQANGWEEIPFELIEDPSYNPNDYDFPNPQKTAIIHPQPRRREAISPPSLGVSRKVEPGVTWQTKITCTSQKPVKSIDGVYHATFTLMWEHQTHKDNLYNENIVTKKLQKADSLYDSRLSDPNFKQVQELDSEEVDIEESQLQQFNFHKTNDVKVFEEKKIQNIIQSQTISSKTDQKDILNPSLTDLKEIKDVNLSARDEAYKAKTNSNQVVLGNPDSNSNINNLQAQNLIDSKIYKIKNDSVDSKIVELTDGFSIASLDNNIKVNSIENESSSLSKKSVGLEDLEDPIANDNISLSSFERLQADLKLKHSKALMNKSVSKALEKKIYDISRASLYTEGLKPSKIQLETEQDKPQVIEPLTPGLDLVNIKESKDNKDDTIKINSHLQRNEYNKDHNDYFENELYIGSSISNSSQTIQSKEPSKNEIIELNLGIADKVNEIKTKLKAEVNDDKVNQFAIEPLTPGLDAVVVKPKAKIDKELDYISKSNKASISGQTIKELVKDKPLPRLFSRENSLEQTNPIKDSINVPLSKGLNVDINIIDQNERDLLSIYKDDHMDETKSDTSSARSSLKRSNARRYKGGRSRDSSTSGRSAASDVSDFDLEHHFNYMKEPEPSLVQSETYLSSSSLYINDKKAILNKLKEFSNTPESTPSTKNNTPKTPQAPLISTPPPNRPRRSFVIPPSKDINFAEYRIEWDQPELKHWNPPPQIQKDEKEIYKDTEDPHDKKLRRRSLSLTTSPALIPKKEETKKVEIKDTKGDQRHTLPRAGLGAKLQIMF